MPVKFEYEYRVYSEIFPIKRENLLTILENMEEYGLAPGVIDRFGSRPVVAATWVADWSITGLRKAR